MLSDLPIESAKTRLSAEQTAPEQLLVDHPSPQADNLLEQVSFGIILLDQERNATYANPEHQRLLGFNVLDYDDIEDWLRESVPDPIQAPGVLASWRENVWQKQVTKTFQLD